MNRKLADYVKKVKLQKKQRKRVSAFFAAMSLTVTCSVSDEEQRSENTSDAVQFRGSSESGIEVIASADKTAFPEGTEMSVTDISAETAMEAAEMVDIDMLDGIERQPAGVFCRWVTQFVRDKPVA